MALNAIICGTRHRIQVSPFPNTFLVAIVVWSLKSQRLSDEVVFDPARRVVVLPTAVFHEFDTSSHKVGLWKYMLLLFHMALLTLVSLFSLVTGGFLVLAYLLVYVKLGFELRRVKRRVRELSNSATPAIWRLG